MAEPITRNGGHETFALWHSKKGQQIMDQVVQMVAEKTGLSPDMARQAVTTVLGFLKDKLPGPVAAQVENALNNQAPTDQGSGIVDKAKDALGGLFGQ
jgi:uncharacterized protein (DUF2267 family)